MSSCCHIVRPQGFMAAQRSCFIRQGRPAVAFHTIVRRRTRCIPTSDQALCPVGISRGKAASKADKCTTNVPPYAARKGHPGGSKASNARSKMQENDIMCRTDSSFLDLLGPGLLRVSMQDSPLAKRKLFIKLS